MTTLLETSKIFSWHFNPFEWHSKWHLAKNGWVPLLMMIISSLRRLWPSSPRSRAWSNTTCAPSTSEPPVRSAGSWSAPFSRWSTTWFSGSCFASTWTSKWGWWKSTVRSASTRHRTSRGTSRTTRRSVSSCSKMTMWRRHSTSWWTTRRTKRRSRT